MEYIHEDTYILGIISLYVCNEIKRYPESDKKQR